MATGIIQQITDDCVHITSRRQSFVAPLDDVHKDARTPGARVRFDIVQRDGVAEAAKVRLRAGTRTHGSQHRFGDLTGSRNPMAKTRATAVHQARIDSHHAPEQVIEAVLEAVASGRLDDATALFAPDATICATVGAPADRGHKAVRRALEFQRVDDTDALSITTTGNGRDVTVTAANQGRWKARVSAGQVTQLEMDGTLGTPREPNHVPSTQYDPQHD